MLSQPSSRTTALPTAARPPTTASAPAEPGAETAQADAALRKAARALEAGFLAEMLKAARLGDTPESFGGGSGEDQFSSFLREAQAAEIARSGGIGLAESLFAAMKARADDAAR